MEDNRIIFKKVNIDKNKIKNFFNSRAEVTGNSFLSVNLQNDKNISNERDFYESNLIIPLLNLKKTDNVFEIGCGLGRFVNHIKDKINNYLGIDFSSNLISMALENFKDFKNLKFQEMSANNIENNKLLNKPPFSIIMTMGLMMYLNDEDFEYLVGKILELSDKKSTIYIRESISIMDYRLTLKDFYSEELKTNYNAIYRTTKEYERLFNNYFVKDGFKLVGSDLLLKGNMVNRKETNQRYWIYRR